MLYGGHWSCQVSSHCGPEAFPRPEKEMDLNQDISPDEESLNSLSSFSVPTTTTSCFSFGATLQPPQPKIQSIREKNAMSDLMDITVEDTDPCVGFCNGFGLDCSLFAEMTEHLEAHTPEEVIVRLMLLDYFEGLKSGSPKDREIDPDRIIFSHESQYKVFHFESSLNLLLSSLMVKIGWKGSPSNYFCNSWPFNFNFPEWRLFRDIAVGSKLFLMRCIFPGDTLGISQPLDFLSFQMNGPILQILAGNPNSNPVSPLSQKLNFPSLASPLTYTRQLPSETEDDILHLPNLPDFIKVVSASDSELLLSFLTTSYIRVPLLLAYFCN